MADIYSSLTLKRLVFDKLEFHRKGFKNDNELNFELQVQIGATPNNLYKVALVLKGEKPEEYDITIGLSGFFVVEDADKLDEKLVGDFINKNAVAILMPYLRSELTLMTAQPEMDSVVLPPFNINKMLEK